MAPFSFSPMNANLLALGIGVCFGFVLERAGFGNARVLAAQFYLHNMRVLKVMFTAIVTAMLLIFASSALGWLNFDQIWVPPTYLWPGILGGLLLGVGFILGGYCPGTSLVAMGTLKIDGVAFVLGVLAGMLAFGQTVPAYWEFYNQSGFFGRLTLYDLAGVDAGWVVLGVVLMAVGVFWAVELVERAFHRSDGAGEAEGAIVGPDRRSPRGRLLTSLAVAAGLGIALLAIAVGQPTIDRKIAWSDTVLRQRLERREVQIDPAELLGLIHNNQIPLRLIDVRPQSDYNLFHLVDALRVPVDRLDAVAARFRPDEIVVLMSNDERAATEAWKRLAVRGGINAYVLAGGMNRWLDVYGRGLADAPGADTPATGDDSLRYRFDSALGDRYAASRPSAQHAAPRPFTAKVKTLQPVHARGGGCG